MVRKCWTVSWADKPTDERWREIRNLNLITVNDPMKEYQSFGWVGYHVWLWLHFDTSISAVSACRRFLTVVIPATSEN